MTVVFPVERLRSEAGRKKILSARYGIILSLIQGFGIAVGLESMAAPDDRQRFLNDESMG